MFNISRILDPMQSKIVLFVSRFTRGPRSAKHHRRRSRIEHNAHTTGAKPKVLQRRQTQGITSDSHSSPRASGSSTNSWAVRDHDYYYDAALNDENCCILKAENTLFKVKCNAQYICFTSLMVGLVSFTRYTLSCFVGTAPLSREGYGFNAQGSC